ncbi:MAG: hypothetical protein ACO3UM_00460 [Planctomycetota bacterium]
MRGWGLWIGAAVAAAAAWTLVGRVEHGPGPGGLPPVPFEETRLTGDGEAPRIRTPRPQRAESTERGLICELLRADMRTAAPGRSLQVYSFRPGRMTLPEYQVTVRTGDDGRATVRDLPPGHYLICGPGASPRDSAPRTARVEVGTGLVQAIVVEAADVRPLRVEVRSDYAPRYGIAPKVVLTRLDDGSGARFEQPGVLRPGVEAFDLPLPVGTYAMAVLPEGELLPAGPSDQVRVADREAPLLLHLVENRARVDVTLKGLPPTEFPARVHAQPTAGALQTDLPERTWWGPYKWHQADMTLPALQGPRRLLVFGARGTFRSVGPVDVSGDRAVVEVEPAARVVVDIFDWDPEADAGLVLDAVSGDEELARVLKPRFGDGYPELDRPSLGGEIFVSAEVPLTLVGRRADGTEAFRRVLAAADLAPTEAVRVSVGVDGGGVR